MRTRPMRFVAVLAIFGLLTACSDGDDDTASTDETTTTVAEMEDTETTEAELAELLRVIPDVFNGTGITWNHIIVKKEMIPEGKRTEEVFWNF